MSDSVATSYDDVPYSSRPYYACHIDCMGTMGTLLGLPVAPPRRCRVLEIGCAAGGNLIPMALQFPESRLVGIDLSVRQIAEGHETIQALGLTNIDLRAQSIMEIDSTTGLFDYIICHGVYSWVPQEVREKIMAVCHDNLSANGIANISYNTFPGWFQRKTLRDLMNFHVQRFPEPATRIQQARMILSFLESVGETTKSSLPQLLKAEIKRLKEAPDYYLFHEYLEAENQPFYFSEFMAHAQAHGLQYLGNSFHHINPTMLPSSIHETLNAISENIVQLEQFGDFFSNCPFRKSLLCQANATLDRSPDPSIVYDLSISTLARPVSEKPDLYSNAPEIFRVNDDLKGTIDQPLAKTMFQCLYEVWPESLRFNVLWNRVRELLAAHDCLPPILVERGREILAQHLIQGYLTNFLSLHIQPFTFVLDAGDRPRASPLARLQILKGQPDVANLRHSVVKLDDFDRILLPLLDGTRDRGQLLRELIDQAQAGKISISRHEHPTTLLDEIQAGLQMALNESLHRLGKKCLLEA